MKRANEWTRDTLTKWGLQNAHLESWGTIRPWMVFEAIQRAGDRAARLPANCLSESVVAGTRTDPVAAEVVYFDAKDEADLARFKGKLKGKIVLTAPMREVKALFRDAGHATR